MCPKVNIDNYERPLLDFSPPKPRLVNIKDKSKINIRYPLIAPFSFAHIFWDSSKKELFYELEEPSLTPAESDYLGQIIIAMRQIINFDEIIEKNLESVLAYIDNMLKLLVAEMGKEISKETYEKFYYYLYREFIGFNEIDSFLKDYFIEDIECNGVGIPLYIVHRVYRNLETNIVFKNIQTLSNFVEKLAQRCGKYVSYASPILDGTLPDGSRVNATYTSDITSRGPTFTIRKFTKKPWTPPQLIAFRTLSPEMLAYLWLLVEYKSNILIAGGTSAGKTTLLNAIAFFIPPEDRVVSIEDTRELNLPRENWIPAVSRGSTTVEGTGEVTLFDLLKSSFRQNPNYVIVGEVRGKEAYVLFQGMASGHSSLSTIHGDSVETVIKRLETPPINLSPTLLNILDSVCVMTHAIVNNEETRKLREIVEIVDVKQDGTALTNTPFVWNSYNNKFYFKHQSKVFEKISHRFGIPMDKLIQEFNIRTKLLYKWYVKGIFDFKKVQELINQYYQEPRKVLTQFGLL